MKIFKNCAIIIYIFVFTSILSLEKNYKKQNVVSLTKNELIDNNIKHDSLNLYENQEKLIVSLTSYPDRIKYVNSCLNHW